MDCGTPPPRRRSDRPVNAEQLREHLVAVLADANQPMSTTQARLAVTEVCRRRGRPVVAEEVYRALVILARRGVVRRVADQPGRITHWELTPHHLRRPRQVAAVLSSTESRGESE